MKKQTLLLAVLAGSAVVSSQAQSLFDWTFTATSGPSTGVIGSGTGTVDTSSDDYLENGGYLVESLSGTWAGQTVTLAPAGGFFGGDNLLRNLTGTPEQLDDSGINFQVPVSPDSFGWNILGYGTDLANDEGSDGQWYSGTFSANLVVAPVPESAVNPGLLAAAGLFIGWRSWRTVRVARA